jgi:hypothetical protein
VRHHGAQTVFVASDDEEIGEFRRLWDEGNRQDNHTQQCASGPDNHSCASPPRLIILDRIRVPSHSSHIVGEFPYQFKGNVDYSMQALEDLWLLSESQHFIGTLSSHFSAVPALLRHAKGHFSLPSWLDLAGVRSGAFQIGLLHISNLGRGPRADKLIDERFRHVARRFLQLHEHLVPHFEASFSVNATDGLPVLSWQVFDLVVKGIVDFKSALIGPRRCTHSDLPFRLGEV